MELDSLQGNYSLQDNKEIRHLQVDGKWKRDSFTTRKLLESMIACQHDSQQQDSLIS